MQHAGARRCGRRRFIALMVLRLWMHRQLIVFVVQFFRAAFAVAMDDCAGMRSAAAAAATAGASRIAATFR